MSKSATIKHILAQTKAKRIQQQCSVFELKVDKGHLSKQQKEQIKRLFLETKWFYNHVIGSEDVFTINTKIKQVNVYVKDIPEIRKLNIIGSQVKQAITDDKHTVLQYRLLQ